MCAAFAGGEPSSLVGCAWAGNLNFAQGLAMGGDDIAGNLSFPKTTRLWTPWGAQFGALCEHGLVKTLMHHHGWAKGRALVWVQWFWDDMRVQCRTATAADCE